jgi:Ca2+-binding EF-hand superfamily protein
VAALKSLDIDGDGNISLAEASPPMGPAGDPNQQMEQMFTQSDKNGDGKLTANELPEGAGRTLQQADQDGDGALSREEVAAAMQARQGMFGGQGGRGGFDPSMGQQMMQQMRQLDVNGDGQLTPNEVPPQFRGMLQGADRNNNQAIDWQELQGAMGQMGQRRGGGGFGGERGFGGEQPPADGRGARSGRGGQ